MKALLIVNGQAGKGKTRTRWIRLEGYLQTFGIHYDVHFTTRPKAAIEVVKHAAANQYTHVIAVGGDGTVNEVVNGIAGQNIVFGVLPTGTGNDFARMLQIPVDPFLAVKKIGTEVHRPVDLLQLNGGYVAGAVGIGLDGAVAEDINRVSWKKRMGTFGYVLSMLKLIFTFPPFSVHLEIDSQVFDFQGCWLVAIGNSQFYGGGMKICPNAKFDDGLLDVCIVHNLTHLQLIKLFPSVFTGKHILHPNVLCLQGRSVRIQTDPAVPVHGDGEILGKTPGEIYIRPQALHVIY
ncbi:diacylglycerol/lipid kinase family protein [Effusibacillus dendaii]|uniref:Diacylglycerol kinase n=1 Tax=Effusibacillus dendaii TaxID=2743772 RepID=A0A7I8D509_9BACL|nr:diacylglycerol kinase family protein [Effusibacillus dendaii]BCJ85147.1 diacylglycerol kinase [Effusibacillus dendaii]